MDKHWLITYQQCEYGRENRIVANCATSKSPAQWLLDTCAAYHSGTTVLMSAIEITEQECLSIQETL